MPAPTSWLTFLHYFAPCFTTPGTLLFEQLVTAWALCPGRRTLTRLWSVIPAERRRRYGAYARWVRTGKWSPDELWRHLVVQLVEHWAPAGRLVLLLDDTLVNKSGRKVDGAGYFHDAVTSTAVAHKVTAWGLNVVVLALRVPSPWGGEPLALPVMVCLHRKSGKGATEEEEELSLIELAAWMVFRLIEWLPDRRFRLVADGAYAPLLRFEFPRTALITRIRRDAALFDLAPPRTGRRGRPRTKGQRLATPLGLAAALTDADWTTVEVCVRGQMVERELWSRVLLWYETARSRPHLLVIVRDPSGHQHDDFFITSDTSMTPAEVASLYSAPLGHRGHEQEPQAVPRRPEPAVLGRRRARARRRSGWLALLRRLALVPRRPRRGPDLARPTLVHDQAHALVRRCPGRSSQRDLVGNSRRSRSRPRLPTNRDLAHLRTGERRLINGRSR